MTAPEIRDDPAPDAPAHSGANTAPERPPLRQLIRPFGDEIPGFVQRAHMLTILAFVAVGTALAVAWTGEEMPPRDLFVGIAGINAALVIALAVDAQNATWHLHRWLQTGVTGAVAATLLVSLGALGLPEGETGNGIATLAIIPSFGGTGMALASIIMFLTMRLVQDAEDRGDPGAAAEDVESERAGA